MRIFFKNALYRRWTSLSWLSMIGDTLFYIAFLSYASSTANPSLAVMIITLSETLPKAFQLIFGLIADFLSNRLKTIIRIAFSRTIIYALVSWIFISSDGLWVIFIVALLNALSDSLGEIASSAMNPFFKTIVKEEEFEEALGFNQSFISVLQVVTNLLSSFLLLYFSYSGLAFINAVSFLVVGLGIIFMKNVLDERNNSLANPNKFSFKKGKVHLFESLKTVMNNKKLLSLLAIIIFINGCLFSIVPLTTTLLAGNRTAMIRTVAFTLAIINSSQLIFMIIGMLLSSTLFKKIRLKVSEILSITGLLVVSIGYYNQSIFLVIVGSSLTALFIGIMNPRLRASILKDIPNNQLGTALAGIDTLTIFVPSLISSLLTIINAGFGITNTSYMIIILLIVSLIAIIKKNSDNS